MYFPTVRFDDCRWFFFRNIFWIRGYHRAPENWAASATDRYGSRTKTMPTDGPEPVFCPRTYGACVLITIEIISTSIVTKVMNIIGTRCLWCCHAVYENVMFTTRLVTITSSRDSMNCWNRIRFFFSPDSRNFPHRHVCLQHSFRIITLKFWRPWDQHGCQSYASDAEPLDAMSKRGSKSRAMGRRHHTYLNAIIVHPPEWNELLLSFNDFTAP